MVHTKKYVLKTLLSDTKLPSNAYNFKHHYTYAPFPRLIPWKFVKIKRSRVHTTDEHRVSKTEKKLYKRKSINRKIRCPLCPSSTPLHGCHRVTASVTVAVNHTDGKKTVPCPVLQNSVEIEQHFFDNQVISAQLNKLIYWLFTKQVTCPTALITCFTAIPNTSGRTFM